MGKLIVIFIISLIVFSGVGTVIGPDSWTASGEGGSGEQDRSTDEESEETGEKESDSTDRPEQKDDGKSEHGQSP